MLFFPAHQWPAILSHLKLRPCTHCHRIGTLNAHGYLRGYGEGSDLIIRGRRLYCSNRGHKNGCGRTHALFLPDVLPTFSLMATLLWHFLCRLVAGSSRRSAFLFCFGEKNPRRAYWLWKRCVKVQSVLRSRLSLFCHPPPSQEKSPFIQVIQHLAHAFPQSPCPIASYQQHFQLAYL
jgi:hypothetical protein